MKVVYRQAASDDVVRQFRYYLVDQNLPEIAVRFRDAVRLTVESLSERPLMGARYSSKASSSQSLRSWPVAGFQAVRIYYTADRDVLHVIRILHGKRDLKLILEKQKL